MADPSDLLVVGGGGAGIGALVVGLLKWSGSRNIGALDKTLADLSTAVTDLRKEVQALREAQIGLAKDIGSLQADVANLEKRVDGQGAHYREQLEEHRRLVHDRMTQATHAMLETVENIGKRKR